MSEIKRIDAHLGTNASDQLIADIVKTTAFDTMKAGKAESEKVIEIVFDGTMYRKGVSFL